MSSSQQSCVVCGGTQSLHRLLPHYSSQKRYKHIHNMCLLLFDSDWTDNQRVNERLYYGDYMRRCDICNQKNGQQVIRCPYSSCRQQFHLTCANQPFYENGAHEYRNARLLIYCSHHSQLGGEIVDLDGTVRTLMKQHLEYKNHHEPGQVRKHNRHKKKRSRSKEKHHKRQPSASSEKMKFSSTSSNKTSRKQSPVTIMRAFEPTPILQLPNPIVSTQMISSLFTGREVVSQVPAPAPPPEEPPSQQQIYPVHMPSIQEVPQFPNIENDIKRDQQVVQWWDRISSIYFQEVSSMPLTELEQPRRKWYEQAVEESLFEYARQSNYGIYISQIEPLIYVRYLYRQSLNVMLKCNGVQYLVRYNHSGNCSNTVGNPMQSQLKVYRDEHPVQLQEFEGEIGRDLTYIEQTELSLDEYLEGLQLEQDIQLKRTELEEEMDGVEFVPIEQLDIAYHILKDQLNTLVVSNNREKQRINEIRQPVEVQRENQQLIMDCLRWTQIVRGLQNGYRDKQSEVLQTFFRLPPSHNENSQKGLIKIHSVLSRQNNNPLETDCKICFDNNFTDENTVVYCDRCQTSFHKACYGLVGTMSDETEFLCDGCTYEAAGKVRYMKQFKQKPNQDKVKCGICKKLGFPQRQIKDRFYHVTCLILTNLIRIRKGLIDLRPKVCHRTIEQMVRDNEESTPQCSVCGSLKGYRFQCSENSLIQCRHAFHPICAYLNGLLIDIESDPLETACRELRFTTVRMKIKCVLHCGKTLDQLLEQTYYRRFALNFEQTAKMGGYEQFLQEFRNSKEYKYDILSNLRYLTPSKNDSVYSYQYNQHNGAMD